LGRLACLDFGADILITRDIRMCPVGCARELNRLREPMQPLRPHVRVAAQDVEAAMGQRVLSRIGSAEPTISARPISPERRVQGVECQSRLSAL
jgi:hypothetical protein